MCRWLAYSGAPLYLEELIFKPEHSLIDQSLSSRSLHTPTSGDGFGIGWYGGRRYPGLYRSVQPAWNNENLRDLAAQIEAPMFLAHVRAATLGSIQRSNSHPFRYRQWLFMHNGLIADFPRIRRTLMLAIHPDLFPLIRGSADSEVMFYLALTFGLMENPIPAVARMVGFVEQVAAEAGVEDVLQMTLGISEGTRIIGVRYSTCGESRTLYHSRGIEALHELRPEVVRFSADARAVVSEPLSELTDFWAQIPESSYVVVEQGAVEVHRFSPLPPS